ncbi:UDP-glucose 4-epimerase [Hydrogenophaga crassostreae]|uniref:UDP-glucose 4-epimerase n=1 Tax=Hydrogenophaga crassostreae TaxID=1763535 RepID=A0A163C424_9BURK|nr:UDP-glucose 4-epimerase GalE [Hydrogenophaga crassostreae]AOW15141.1 UDP-glucose 4-epimerase GalE [Hydrogenophaga crassostreae]OAD39231.1 UDP-glucose 4-epimerase [Hydrogenophaga crassostreae]
MTSTQPKILLTGGAGYIGSHTALAVAEAGFEPIILDNFANSHPAVIERLKAIRPGTAFTLERGDVLDGEWLEGVMRRHALAGIVHFAGDKAVGESAANPLKYFHNNIGGAVSLLRVMERLQAEPANGNSPMPALVFSSSATVYGDPASSPVAENFPLSHASPYAHSKLVIEEMLAALRQANAAWRIGVLRYFNPVGAHPSGLIGEDPSGIPNNLMPFVAQVAVGKRERLSIFGNDYPTLDGTGVRDYIHVQDLARGHVAALSALLSGQAETRNFTVNLGTGVGCSVMDVLKAFEAASGRPIPYQFEARRAGDVAEYYANPALAKRLLGWEAQHTLQDMCADAWRWQNGNPNGYSVD